MFGAGLGAVTGITLVWLLRQSVVYEILQQSVPLSWGMRMSYWSHAVDWIGDHPFTPLAHATKNRNPEGIAAVRAAFNEAATTPADRRDDQEQR